VKYISTRGRAPAVDFVGALMAGLASDGGLYSPATWPTLTRREIADLAGRPYAEVAARVLAPFIGEEIPMDVVRRLCAEAYAGFRHPAVTPLTQLDSNTFLLELFHGPSLAFKDVAMQLLGRLYAHVLALRDQEMTIVCATSGDTGGAAVEAFRGLPNVRLVVLFPEGRISEVQRRFMTTTGEANVRTVAVAGDFDDCQAILKALFQDATFAGEVSLAAVNSINFARIIAQSVYFFVAAAALGAPHRKVNFVVPTGNFGDAFAGFSARAMGLPIGRIIAATNSNDIVARALTAGDYARGTGVATQSPAMDIQVASNFERLYFECAGRDGAETRRAFDGFAQARGMTVPAEILTTMNQTFGALAVSEADTTGMIATTCRDTGLAIDPHTAVAMAARHRSVFDPGDGPVVVVSTAHAAKFPEAVSAATGRPAPQPEVVIRNAGLTERIDRLPADEAEVKRYVRDFVGA